MHNAFEDVNVEHFYSLSSREILLHNPYKITDTLCAIDYNLDQRYNIYIT